MSHSSSGPSQELGTQSSWTAISGDEPSALNEESTDSAQEACEAAPSHNTEEREGLLKADAIVSHRQSISSTSSRLSVNKVPRVVAYEKSVKFNVRDSESHKSAAWLPYTLRRPFLLCLAVASLALAVALVALCAYSMQHYGLTDDDDSVGQYIARRYVPTILAVLFTLAITIVAEDVKRTEAFARMAGPKHVAANYTLFYIPKVWWKSMFDGLSARQNGGHRRWLLTVSSIVAGISVLVISTFSSSVFVTKEVFTRTDAPLRRYTPQQNGSIVLQPRRDTYTRSISGVLYNATTSLWVSDSHVILPFTATSESATSPVLQEGIWKASTKVLKLESTCMSMILAEKTAINITFSSSGAAACNGTCSKQSRGLKFRSDDGCEIQIQTPIAVSVEQDGANVISNPVDGYFTDVLALQGGIMWTNLTSSWQSLGKQYGTYPPIDVGGDVVLDRWRRTFIYDFSDQCQGRELLFVSPPWFADRVIPSPPHWQDDYWANFTARVELCTPKYSEADIPVTATIGGASPGVSFNAKEFERNKKSVTDDLLDFERLNDLAFGQAWLKYFPAPAGDSDVEGFEGVSMLLAKTFSLKLVNLLSNSTLTAEANRLRARFFGELVLSSVTEADTPVLENLAGASIRPANRIVVIPGIAIALAVLLSLAACYSLAMLWFASTQHRPLNLKSDPAAFSGIVPLVDLSSRLAADLRAWREHDRTTIQKDIGHRIYTLQAVAIKEETAREEEEPGKAAVTSGAERTSWLHRRRPREHSKSEWRPSMLRKTWLSALLFGLTAIVIAMLVLRKFADNESLFQTAFVQQVNLSLFHTSFSPHSVIAALIAVTVGLCWDNIDKAMRTLQPFLTMSKDLSGPSRGIAISYQSSYWVWAAIKSARSRHWILSLVTIGTTLSQILVISMAAVFERHVVIHTQPTQDMNIMTIRTLVTRQEPFEFSIGIGKRPFYLTDNLLKTSESDWLYNALDDITLNTPVRPWTSDEWVFTPVNITNQDDPSVLYVASASQSEARNVAASITSSFNVSLTTSALRGRLECEAITVSGTDWLDNVQDVYPNRFDQSVTGHVLPVTLAMEKGFAAPTFSAPRRLACCTNGTENGGQSVIAYWSSNTSVYDEQPSISLDPNQPEDFKVSSGWTKDFAIKWIVGSTASTLIPGTQENFISNTIGTANETALYFTQEPQLSILKCNPIIEQAKASITFARDTSQILSYELLEPPQPVVGAWDYAYDVEYPNPESNSSTGNVSYGAYFLSQLLTAPHIVEPQMRSSMMVYNHTLENLAAERFALRDTDKGTNMDYMSYSNFILAKKDPTALLNTTTLQRHSEKTFQTFFKHFATSGNWTYGGSSRISRAAYEEPWGYLKQTEEFVGTITERIEVLSMNKVATWLSLAILFLLMIILIVLIVALQVVYPPTSMLRHVECLADVLAMVAGSDEMVRLVDGIGVEGMEKAGITTKLGWFRDKRGTMRWGVNVVDTEVEWLAGPEEEGKDTRTQRSPA